MTKRQFETIIEWQNKQFPDACAISKIEHLREETEELISAIAYSESEENKRFEFADCFMLLFGAAAKHGMSYEDICSAIWEKFNINLKRKWGEPDARGIVHHVKI